MRQEDIERAKKIYAEVKTISATAIEMKVSKTYARRLLIAGGVDTTYIREKVTPEERVEIFKAYAEQGKTTDELAEQYGISISLVRAVIRDFKVYEPKFDERDLLHHIKTETRLISPEPVYDGFGNLQGYDYAFLYGVESVKKEVLPKWKIDFEKKGIVNFGYGYFKKEIKANEC